MLELGRGVQLLVILWVVSVQVAVVAIDEAYSSAIGVRLAVAAAVGARLAITSFGLAIGVSAVLLIVLRHCGGMRDAVKGGQSMGSGDRSGAHRQLRKLRERGLTEGAMGAGFLCSTESIREDSRLKAGKRAVCGIWRHGGKLVVMWAMGEIKC